MVLLTRQDNLLQCVFDYAVAKIELNVNLFFIWIFTCKTELNNKFKAKKPFAMAKGPN
jgi:hypothetical protein